MFWIQKTLHLHSVTKNKQSQTNLPSILNLLWLIYGLYCVTAPPNPQIRTLNSPVLLRKFTPICSKAVQHLFLDNLRPIQHQCRFIKTGLLPRNSTAIGWMCRHHCFFCLWRRMQEEGQLSAFTCCCRPSPCCLLPTASSLSLWTETRTLSFYDSFLLKWTFLFFD
jgi:hypothetical protein